MTAATKKTRTGLGRGLEALLGDGPGAAPAPAEPARRPTTTLPIEALRRNPDQPRRIFNEDAIAELAASIRARGLLQPILVRPVGEGVYEIVAGERRWRAAQAAQLHDVPVVIRELTDDQAAEIALIENVQRVDLSPVEEALAYQRLADVFRRTQEDIANAVGKSRSHIANMMRLLNLPKRSFEALQSGRISMGHARALLAAPKPDALLDVVLARDLNVRETETLAAAMAAEKKAPQGRADAPAPGKSSAGGAKDADTRALEADLAAALGLQVAIEHTKKGSGLVVIHYLDLEQLDDVCKRLMGAGV